MYAVIEFQGHQYIVQKGTEISVDKLFLEEKQKEFVVDTVLAMFDEKGDQMTLGMPTIDKATVVCEVIVPMQKDDKIKVLKFKNKNRYQRAKWFRAQKTLLKIKDIKVNG